MAALKAILNTIALWFRRVGEGGTSSISNSSFPSVTSHWQFFKKPGSRASHYSSKCKWTICIVILQVRLKAQRYIFSWSLLGANQRTAFEPQSFVSPQAFATSCVKRCFELRKLPGFVSKKQKFLEARSLFPEETVFLLAFWEETRSPSYWEVFLSEKKEAKKIKERGLTVFEKLMLRQERHKR